MEGRVFDQKSFKIPKMPKIVPKSVKKFFKIKKKFKIPKSPKTFPKVSKRVLKMFWGWFFRILPSFCPVFHGNQKSFKVESSKIFKKKSKKFQNSKNAQNRPQKCPNEIFQKQKNFKNPNMPKIVPKSVQTCFEDVLGWFFRKNFLPSVPWRVESSKIFKKSKNFQNSKNAQNRSQKCPNVFWRCFRVIFLKIFLPSVPWRVESSKFSKKSKKIFLNFLQKNSKNAQNRSQKCPNVFWKCFGAIFSEKIFAHRSMEGRVSENFQKIKKISKIQKCPKSFPKVSKRVLKMF